MKESLIRFSMSRPKTILLMTTIITLITVILALNQIMQHPDRIIDTDPENMLDKNEPVRLFHQTTRERFELFDMVAMGIYHPGEKGVFTPEILQAVNAITEEILALQYNDYIIDANGDTLRIDTMVNNERVNADGSTEVVREHGIIFDDLMALSEIEDINGETGDLVISSLMAQAPDDQQGANEIKKRVDLHPLLANKLASNDGKIIGIYIPINNKKLSYDLSLALEALAIKHLGKVTVDGQPFFGAPEQPMGEFIVAGIPVAQDTFGKYMFEQMGVSAPLAGLVIFILLYVFFRRVKVIVAPMIMAVLAITWTMALLIGSGFTVHIMSSMIPIFLFPIAVLNSIHVISSIHKRYSEGKGLEETILSTYRSLFAPILFTSITTIVGFVSLILTFIPPVQVFGSFVGVGVALAWFLSVTFLPAYLVLAGEKTFEDFGHAEDSEHGLLGKLARGLQGLSQNYSRTVLGMSGVLFILAIIGIWQIEINDNPVKWFKSNHPLRHADELMNSHISGTYMANIVFDFKTADAAGEEIGLADFRSEMQQNRIATAFYDREAGSIWGQSTSGDSFQLALEADDAMRENYLSTIAARLEANGMKLGKASANVALDSDDYEEFEVPEVFELLQESGPGNIAYDAENQVLFGQIKQAGLKFYAFVSDERVTGSVLSELLDELRSHGVKLADASEPFKTPEVLKYMESIERVAVDDSSTVGAVSSMLDILKKVSWELRSRDDAFYKLPETKMEAGQYFFLAKGGENPDDLHKFVTRDYDAAHLWLHLNTGDNKAMEEVVKRVDNWAQKNPPPPGVEMKWAGLNYINSVWQQKMVGGMANSLVGAYITVFLMVVLLFRSLRWGMIAMIPISLTIALIYALIGYIGKPYDMPIAVLSSLTLGLSIDFGIHYIERSRLIHKTTGSYAETIAKVFGEPATAMLQNTIAISIGFVPLFFSDLVPYLTVGAFFFAIMLISGFSTLIILPAISKLLSSKLYPGQTVSVSE